MYEKRRVVTDVFSDLKQHEISEVRRTLQLHVWCAAVAQHVQEMQGKRGDQVAKRW